MAQYRKKPVVIEAVRWRGYNSGLEPLPEWLPKPLLEQKRGPNGSRCYAQPGEILRDGDFIYIGALEGEMCAVPGDWIIRGVKGEIYPCKPDVFATTYEKA